MNLCRLVYYSERNPAIAMDLRTLIATCHKNNAPRSLSGLLHFNGNYFIQILEGGRADVSAVYHKIAVDPRHTNLILISCSDVRERLFPTWSMGLHEEASKKTRDVFLRYLAKERFDPESVNVESLIDVMMDISREL